MSIDLSPDEIPEKPTEFEGTQEEWDSQEKDRLKQQRDAAAQKTRDNEINNRKSKLKAEADQLDSFAGQLRAKIKKSEMTEAEFLAWAAQFENGFTNYTPETGDTPYGRPTANRPRVKILSQDTDYK